MQKCINSCFKILTPSHWAVGWFVVVNFWVLGWVGWLFFFFFFGGGKGFAVLFCFALDIVASGSFFGGTRACIALFLQMSIPIFCGGLSQMHN